MKILTSSKSHFTIDRRLLPEPKAHYDKYFDNLKTNSEWVKVCCPFHEDKKPSMSINLQHGGFICHGGCNIKGDLISFHMKKHGISFLQACKQLGVLA